MTIRQKDPYGSIILLFSVVAVAVLIVMDIVMDKTMGSSNEREMQLIGAAVLCAIYTCLRSIHSRLRNLETRED